ncbi:MULTISPECIES: GntR family transcriptional regulator [unclassified Mameliella]|uniref:GntR family transcriptional regulator n=1 Tax=unclassified Mameliella TaxID=2630630 RepID=UPI00273F8B39|nr:MULTISPECIES: GntR family transcriptional regulator [unclassified Mameliella]
MSDQTTLTDAVHTLLKRAIIEQALKPGMRLPEDTVGEQFGVSRTIVRHALVRLQNEGLVVARRNRGAFVAEPSLEEAKQIFEVRRALEREVIRILVERLPESGFDQLEAHVRSEQSVKGKDGPVSIRLAGEFHTLLAELTGNAVLSRYVSEVVLRCSLIMAMYARTHSSDCAVDEHSQIIEAIRTADMDRAMTLMDHHLGAVAGRAELEKQPDSVSSILSHYGKELGQ